MPDRQSLEQILHDPYSTPEEREIATRELGGAQFLPDTELPEAQGMLAALGKKHVSEITEEAWVNYFAQNHTSASEEFVREWRFFVPPDERTLELLTGQDYAGSLRWYWKTILDTCGKREDVKAHARGRLKELGAA